MTATKAAFVAVDSDAANVGEPVDAALLTRLGRNANKILADQFAPLIVQGYDVRGTDNLIDTKGAPAGLKNCLRLNAPDRAWTMLAEPRRVYIPPGVTSLTVTLRAKIDNSTTTLVQVATTATPFNALATSSSNNVLACAGTGSAVTYEGAVPVTRGRDGWTWLTLFVQTTGYSYSYSGFLNESGPSSYFDSVNSSQFNDLTDESFRIDDFWAKFFNAVEVKDAYVYDSSGASYTSVATALFNTTTDDVTPYVSGAGVSNLNDALYIGMKAPFHGVLFQVSTQGVSTLTGVVEYSNGSAGWPSLTRIASSTGTYQTTDFTEATGYRVNAWDPPSAWAAESVNGLSRYWVRYRCSAWTSTTTAAKLTRARALLPANTAPARVINATPGLSGSVSNIIRTSRSIEGMGDVAAYLVGKGAKCWVHALNVRPTSLSTIT